MNNNLDDLIADYLADGLEPEKRRAFEQRLRTDPALAERVALERGLLETLYTASPENQLRRNLKQISGKFNSLESLDDRKPRLVQKAWFWLAFVLCLLLGSGLFVWNHHRQVPPTVPVPENREHPQPPATPSAEDIAKPTETVKPETPNKSQPIAAAFKTLPPLETYIGSQVRSGDFRFRVDEPENGATLFLRSGITSFRLSGNLEGAAPAGSAFNLLIFSNNLASFEASKPVASQALAITTDGHFQLEKKLTLPPGLYYYLIEERASGEWVVVNKFFVK